MSRSATMRGILLPSLVVISVLFACQADGRGGLPESKADFPGAGVPPAEGTQGMVSSAHPLATKVGLEILDRGGNAFDAAVAVAAALNVVEPGMSGMGGYGTILVYSARDEQARFLNASGRIPVGVDPDAYRPPTPDYRENRRGAKAVSTPGNVNAWAAMAQEYGNLPWAELLEPAATLAEGGFTLDARVARMIQGAWDEFPENARAFYGVDGQPLQEGDTLVQADLARSLRLVAQEGPGVFHGGSIGQAIDQAMRDAGGFLRLEDLRENEAEWWDPISIEYRGYRVMVPPPPANSFPALLRLGIMSRMNVRRMGHNSVNYLHLYEEVTKMAYGARLRYAGDPEINPPPLDTILSPDYWDEMFSTIDPWQARLFGRPSMPEEPGGHTTHFVVADAEGNVVSATQTLGNVFGSRIMPQGTGIWLNNSLAYCTFEPPGNPMDAHPGRRKLSGDVPLFILREGRPWVALGTPGGHTIAQTVPQMVMNILDFGMNIQDAIAAPRIAFAEPDFLVAESNIPNAVVEELRARGHMVVRQDGLGNAHALTIEWGRDGRPVRFTGAADPRGAGLAEGR